MRASSRGLPEVLTLAGTGRLRGVREEAGWDNRSELPAAAHGPQKRYGATPIAPIEWRGVATLKAAAGVDGDAHLAPPRAEANAQRKSAR